MYLPASACCRRPACYGTLSPEQSNERSEVRQDSYIADSLACLCKPGKNRPAYASITIDAKKASD